MSQDDGTLKTCHNLRGGLEANRDMKPTGDLLQLVKAWSKVLMIRREAESDPRSELLGRSKLSGSYRIGSSA